MNRASVDATCKVLLNFLLWTALASMFYLSKGFGTGWDSQISEMFVGGIEYFPAIAWMAAVLMVSVILAVIAKRSRAPAAHRNELFGALVDEVASVVASFGSVLFLVAETDYRVRLFSVFLWGVAWLLFRWAIRLDA